MIPDKGATELTETYCKCPVCGRYFLNVSGTVKVECLSCWSKRNPRVPVSYPRGVMEQEPSPAEDARSER